VTTVPLQIDPAAPERRNLAVVNLRRFLPLLAIAGIIFGGAAKLALGDDTLAAHIWMVSLVIAGFPVVWRTIGEAREGNFATDVVASLSVITAALIGQPLAGLVIVLMQTGGEALEKFAERRASAAVRELEKAAPRIAHRIGGSGSVSDIPVGVLRVGDLFLVRPGEMIPCDGAVVSGSSEIDTSQLSGEALPVYANEGMHVMSGSLNLLGALTIRATALAAESQYSKIVELVREAQESKSPLQRLADRYAVWFTPLTLGVCLATFYFTHSWTSVLAVLVVATPCPLILATPVAIIGGINRAARAKIIMRHGAALEMLSDATLAVFDKTGTLTIGKPKVNRVLPLGDYTEKDLLQIAAGVEQGSSHLLARVVVEEAEHRYGSIRHATQHHESPGQGLRGVVDGKQVFVGSQKFIEQNAGGSMEQFQLADGVSAGLRAYVLIAGKPAGIIEYADALRPELRGFLATLERLGLSRTVLLSGDRLRNAQAVGLEAGIREVHADLLPGDKSALIGKFREHGDVVLMVGDGTNDAPALAAADVGIALAGHGGGVTSEAADVVVLVDDLSKVVDAVTISRRTMRLAKQSIWAGLGLSGIAMVFAALGMIPPTQGAFLQEAIDVAVILNALRASWG
jgi:heavy metal translocating P-type ATPase